jgi:hypothetical protein
MKDNAHNGFSCACGWLDPGGGVGKTARDGRIKRGRPRFALLNAPPPSRKTSLLEW